MSKLVKWVTLIGALGCLVFIGLFYANDPSLILQVNTKNIRGIVMAVAMIILIYQSASSLLGLYSARKDGQSNSTDSASIGRSPPIALAANVTDPVKAALRNNPILTLILIVFGISLPVLFQLSTPRPGGRRFTSDDWTPILVGEALVAMVYFVAWYQVKRRGRKNGNHQ